LTTKLLADEAYCSCYNLLIQISGRLPKRAMRLMVVQRHLEFYVLSYSPSVVAEDRCNIALIALERDSHGICFADARFIPNTDGLLAFDRAADIGIINAFFREVGERLLDPQTADVFLQAMLDSFSNVIRITEAKTVVISDDPGQEIDKLAALYLSQSAGISGHARSTGDG
jgi:hypothetical protein